MELSKKPRVLVVDDHQMVADMLSQLLSENSAVVVSHAYDAVSAMDLIKTSGAFDLVILDYHLPDATGLSAFYDIHSESPTTRIVLMSGTIEKSVVKEAMNAGAAGFLPKSFPVKSFIPTISMIMSGVNFVPADMSDAFQPEGNDNRHLLDGMNSIEIAVLKRLVDGLTNKTIGNQIGRTEVTVKMYVRKICKRLNVINRTQVAMLAKDVVFD